MAGEYTIPTKLQPAVAGNIADPDEYNQNAAGQSRDVRGVDVDGNYDDFDVGDETRSSLVKDLKMREANGAKVKIYNAGGVLQKTTNLTQATESEAGVMPIANQSETDAGVDDTKAITPSKLAAFSGLVGGNLVNVQFFTSSGTYNRGTGVTKALVIAVGGGAGGAAGSQGGVGSAGGNTSFGSHCTANGGAAGTNDRGGTGGAATGGSINLKGSDGFSTGGGDNIGANGAGAIFGGGGVGNIIVGSGSNGSNGSGGGGGFTTGDAGGAGGAAGGAAIKYITSGLGATEIVTIGAGGAGGTGGSSSGGGDGGDGFIIVWEYN